MRCDHERKLHRVNSFLTLTYKDLPNEAGSLVKRDLQLFFKRLRFLRGRFRYYACGEYGELNKRPHYHVILFGMDFRDKRFYKVFNGSNLYSSRDLEAIWGLGQCVIGDVTFESCAYVARYICDKMTGPVAPLYYQWTDYGTGEVHDILPEFTVMSRKPGIGMGWFEKYGDHAYQLDSVVCRGKEMRPPRFYDTKMELRDPELMVRLKAVRKRKALQHREDQTPERRKVKEQFNLLRAAERKRNVGQ